jgi:hypothetical protein
MLFAELEYGLLIQLQPVGIFLTCQMISSEVGAYGWASRYVRPSSISYFQANIPEQKTRLCSFGRAPHQITASKPSITAPSLTLNLIEVPSCGALRRHLKEAKKARKTGANRSEKMELANGQKVFCEINFSSAQNFRS